MLLTVFVYTALIAVCIEVFRLIRNSYPTIKEEFSETNLRKIQIVSTYSIIKLLIVVYIIESSW